MVKKLINLCLILPQILYAADMQSGLHIVNKNLTSFNNCAVARQGFIENNKNTREFQFFYNLKKNAPLEIKKYKVAGKYDTHLKSSYLDIKLSVLFKNISSIKNNEVIGYAPIGSYDNGWTGIRMFFERNGLGICSYSFEKFIGINADSCSVEYFINNKPSFKYIEGNYNEGFKYVISWDINNKTSVYDHNLACFNKNYDINIINKMIYLAKVIDKN